MPDPVYPYDSTEDTLKHIAVVREFLREFIYGLKRRAEIHDASKLLPPEKEAFDEFTPRLRATTYNSPEYRATMEAMRPALEHHYANNSHHPEAYTNGVSGMDLLDLVEMLADWKAASLRHADGNILASLEINRERFGLSDQLYSILKNTIERMNWA